MAQWLYVDDAGNVHAARYKDVAFAFPKPNADDPEPRTRRKVVTPRINFPIESRLGESSGWCQNIPKRGPHGKADLMSDLMWKSQHHCRDFTALRSLFFSPHATLANDKILLGSSEPFACSICWQASTRRTLFYQI